MSLTTSSPGVGHVVARLLPPNRLTLPTVNFQYPLKLIQSTAANPKCLTIFILSYGGGLVSNDAITLNVTVEPAAKLCLLTQGSTKVFKRKAPLHHTTQSMNLHLHPHSSLLLLPDPVSPFADSAYMQTQRFRLPSDDTASVIILDWVTEGRTTRGERWDLHSLVSRNEFFVVREDGTERLMLRDAMVLERTSEGKEEEIRERVGGMGVFGTMVVKGPKFRGLEEGILKRFKEEPRIGNRNWDGEPEKKRRWEGVLWTAARVRGFVLVKVGGENVQDVRGFLRMLLEEGAGAQEVVEEFGEGCLLCLQ